MNSFVVDNANRLDKFLAEKLPDLSRGQIQKAIEESQVLVNGKVVFKPSIKVDIGDEVSFPQLATRNSGLATVPVDLPLKVLYDANDLLIIDKPAGLTVHPGPAVKEDTLSQAIVFHYPEIASVGEPSRPGIVHRLDKDTSGCLLVAKTQSMYEYLLSAFADRKVRKEYLALVWGSLPQKHGVIDTPMGKSKLDFRKRTVVDPLEAKEAKTEYSVISNFKFQILNKVKSLKSKSLAPSTSLSLRGGDALGVDEAIQRKDAGLPWSFQSIGPRNDRGGVVDEVSLIRVLLHTGRTHQIRVHMASIGHPLVGDSLYGPKKQFPGLHRQFLHAEKIEVQLPNGTWVSAESELSEDLQNILRAFIK